MPSVLKNNLYSLTNPAVSFPAMKRELSKGDILYISNVSSLGRTYDEILSEWKYITKIIKADIVALDRKDLFDSRNSVKWAPSAK